MNPPSQQSALVVGAFELEAIIGRGGMGSVWRAVAGRGDRVAVKILDGSSRKEEFLEAFKREVRAMARLDHPGIVDVYDYGVVSEQEAFGSAGRLVAGAPFLAMSLVPDGTLADAGGLRTEARFGWLEMKTALLQVLDALAHAHARGVVHHDLKPDNVLVERFGPQVHHRLADFGIAHAAGLGRDASMAGTPSYMAPEQFRKVAADHGPWTDLYALGCLTHELATGRPPFRAANVLEMALMHAEQPPPPIRSRFPLPSGFEDWLRWLLAKSIDARAQRAADVAYALHRLGEPSVVLSQAPVVRPEEPHRSATTVLAPLTSAPTPLNVSAASPRLEPPPVVQRWEQPALRRRRWVGGVGAGLVALRDHPMVGRHEERARMWSSLREVARERRPGVIVLRGAAGIGKSRLARWLLERAEELGAARGLSASFSSGARTGLEPMVRQLLLAGELQGEALRQRVTARAARPRGPLSRDEVAALVEALEGVAVEAGRRRALIARLLRAAAAQRVVVLWLDDVQWGDEALALAEHLLADGATEPGLAVLMVLTAREEALDGRDEAERLSGIEADPASRTLVLEPLPEAQASALMHELLGLEPSLADRLAHRCGGHPLLATQLVEDLVWRGVLAPQPGGYALRPGAAITLPQELHQVWATRLDGMLEGRPDDDRQALEIAATLGLRVERSAWGRACAHAGVSWSATLAEALFLQRLARPEGDGFRFVHGLLVESILRAAVEAGRSTGNHAACAEALLPIWRQRAEPRVAAALGRHRLAAGQARASLAPLLAAAEALMRRGALVDAQQLLADRREAIELLSAGTEGDSPQLLEERLRGELLAARAASIRARHDEAEERIAAVMSGLSSGALAAEARLEAAEIAERAGRRKQAHERYGQAQHAFEMLGDRRGAGRAATGRGTMAAYLGAIDEAVRVCEEAVVWLTDLDEPLLLGRAERALGRLMLLREDLDRAEALHRSALARFSPLAAEHDIQKTLNGLAEAHRLAGRLDVALEGYEQLLERQRRMVGTSDHDLTRFNAAITLVALGRFEEASLRLREVEAGLVARPNDVLRTGLVFAWLACHAGRGERDALEARLEQARQEVERSDGVVEHDDAVNARLAAELLAKRFPALARACLEVALSHWERHGARDEAAATRALLADLPTKS